MSDTLDFTINGARAMDILPGVHGHFTTMAGSLFSGGNIFTVRSEYGDMLFQEIVTGFGSVWLSMYHITRKAVLSAESATPSLEAMHMLCGNVTFSPDGLPSPLTMRAGDWQMVHLPHTANKVVFPAGTNIMTLDIHYRPGYLETMSPYFPDLDRFLEKVYSGIPATVAGRAVPIPGPVMSLLGGLFENRQSERGHHLYLERHMMDWVAGSLQSPYLAGASVRVLGREEQVVWEVLQYMLENIRKPLTIPALAKMAAMNTYKFKCVFKGLAGMPVRQKLINERMRVAREMLAEGTLTLAEISLLCGYDSYAAFSKEFKRKYGFAPSVFRKKKGQDD